MAEAISDAAMAAALRPFVRASTPVLAALRDSDPLGLVRRVLPAVRKPGTAVAPADQSDVDALKTVDRGLRDRLLDGLESVHVPGTAAWKSMGEEERAHWWVNRVGRVTVLVASVPGLGGVIADRLPLQDTLAVAGQGLLLCAIATEYGMTDQADQVRLLGKIIFDRDIAPAIAAGKGTVDSAGEDRATAELTEDLSGATAKHGKITISAVGRTLWRFGRTLWALGSELDKRPQGRFYHKLFGLLPLVGMLADYFGERSALKRAAKRAARWIHKQRKAITTG